MLKQIIKRFGTRRQSAGMVALLAFCPIPFTRFSLLRFLVRGCKCAAASKVVFSKMGFGPNCSPNWLDSAA